MQACEPMDLGWDALLKPIVRWRLYHLHKSALLQTKRRSLNQQKPALSKRRKDRSASGGTDMISSASGTKDSVQIEFDREIETK